MDMTQLVKDLTDAKALVLTKDAELGTLTATATAAKTSVTELTAKVDALTAENTALKAGDLVKVTTERDAAFSFVREEADRLCVASGEAKLKTDATLDELKASIQTNRTKLAASIPAGGRSEGTSAGSGNGVSNAAAKSHAASFATK